MTTIGCTHRKVTTYVFVDGNHPAGLWACADCGHKFAPVNISEQAEAVRYRKVRRGQHWSVIDGVGHVLRGDALDAAVDATPAVGAA